LYLDRISWASFLWAKAIDNGQANLEAANASIQEIKRGWNLSRSIDILIQVKQLEKIVSADCGKAIVS
jgi:hypothetical protein